MRDCGDRERLLEREGGLERDAREKVDFIETTALRQRRNGGREVTVTSRLHRQKDKERQKRKVIDARGNLRETRKKKRQHQGNTIREIAAAGAKDIRSLRTTGLPGAENLGPVSHLRV